jgi:hypothetical protein
MFGLKRRMLIGLLVSLGLLGGIAGSQVHASHLSQSGPHIQYVAGEGGPSWPTTPSETISGL